MKYLLVRAGLVRYWVRTDNIIWWKTNSAALAQRAAEEWSRRLGGKPVQIYDRLKFKNVT